MRRPGWYTWAAMLASSVLLAAGSVLISLHAQHESDRKWCSIVQTMDAAYRQEPPATPTGQQMAADIRALRRGLGCPA